MNRKPYPSDVSDDEWAFVAPYLTLMSEDAPQRDHPLREVFNALRYVVRGGIPWRMLPNDLPPWHTVYQQAQRWLKASVFEAIVHDVREVLRLSQGHNAQPRAAILDSRTLQSSPESGADAGYDGAKRRKGRKTHMVVDTLGNLLVVRVHPAGLADSLGAEQVFTGLPRYWQHTLQVVWADGAYTDRLATWLEHEFSIRLVVVKRDTQPGFKLLPRRWVVERTFAWLGRFRRLSKDYERCVMSSKAVVYLAAIRRLLSRLAP